MAGCSCRGCLVPLLQSFPLLQLWHCLQRAAVLLEVGRLLVDMVVQLPRALAACVWSG